MTVFNDDLSTINNAVELSFFLCEKLSKKSNNPLAKIDEIIYKNAEDYLHFYPKELILKLTSNCNLRCKHCFFYGKPESYSVENELEPQIFLEKIKNLVKETYITQCKISGGEIFTSPIIKDVINFLKSKNISLNLISNATLITTSTADWLSKVLNPRYDNIQISLEGASAETNDYIRGKGTFEKIISAIALLKERNINVEIGFTVNSLNVSEISKMYELSKSLNVDKLNIGKFTLVEESQRELIPDTKDIFINIAKLAEIYDGSINLQIRCLKVPDFLNYEIGKELLDKKLVKSKNVKKTLHCSPNHQKFALFPNGDITFCYACEENELILGNIIEDEFSNIWAKRFSNPMFEKRSFENNLCKNCKYISLCLCGCPYRAYKKYNNINGPAFDCAYLKSLIEEENGRSNNN